MSFTSTNMAGELGKIHVPIQPLEETLAKLTVPELQQRLKKRGLKKSGVKAKLIQRLKEAIELENDEDVEDNVNQSVDGVNESMEDRSMEESFGAATSISNKSMEIQDPYAEFESGIPGVTDTEGEETAVEDRTANYFQINEEEQPESMDSFTVSTGQESEGHGLEDEVHKGQIDQSSKENIERSRQIAEHVVDTEEGQTLEEPLVEDEEAETDFVQKYEEQENQQFEVPAIEDETDHQGEEEERENERQFEDEVPQVEDGNEVDGGSVESSRGEDIVANKEPEKKIETDTHQDDNEEIGIEINVDKSEKDEFYVHEEEQEKQADLSTKEEVKQEKKKVTAPVQLKKRRGVIEDTKQDVPIPRKRRWGSSTNKESLTISSESLKGLIPDVSVIPTPNEDPLGLGLDYGEMEEGEIDEEVDTQMEEESDVKEGAEANENEDGNFKKEVRRGRIVRISMKDTVKLQKIEAKEENETKSESEKDTKMEVTIPEEKVSLLPEVSSEDPEYVKERSPSPAKNEPSNILSIKNLVRPFTLRQLREFLSKNGTVVEDGFWINRIKSHCYVTYETVDEAVASRSEIHGSRWPAANPKLLSADFAINDEMYRDTEGKLGQPPVPVQAEEAKPKREKSDERQRRRERSLEREKREHKRDQSREKEKRAEESTKPKEKKEAPAKLLDDLFRKTKATPCIYWLPLTKEQVAAKEKEREKHRESLRKLNEEVIDRENKEREERRKQRDIEVERRQRERATPPRCRFDARVARPLPAQYRNKRRSQSSSSNDE